MKKSFTFRSTLLALIAFLAFNTSGMAQDLSACYNYDVVAESCVGECGNPAELKYEVTGPCTSRMVPMCLRNVSSNLCPSHRGVAFVYVDGQPIVRGDITTVGSTLSFSAPCGSVVKVVVNAIDVVPGIECVRLGNLKFALSRR